MARACQAGALAAGKVLPFEMSKEDVDAARLWVVNAHVNRISGLTLRWTRCKYEHWWSKIPADMVATAEDSDTDDDVDSDAEVS